MKISARKAIFIWLLGTLISLFYLSLVSNYRIYDVESMNLDIALMLSPYGIFNNLILSPDHYLAPYYSGVSQRGEFMSKLGLLIDLIINTVLALGGLKVLARPENLH